MAKGPKIRDILPKDLRVFKNTYWAAFSEKVMPEKTLFIENRRKLKEEFGIIGIRDLPSGIHGTNGSLMDHIEVYKTSDPNNRVLLVISPYVEDSKTMDRKMFLMGFTRTHKIYHTNAVTYYKQAKDARDLLKWAKETKGFCYY